MSALPLPDPIAKAYGRDPRTAYAKALMENQGPALTNYSGLVNVLQSALGGYAQRKTNQDFQGQTQQYNRALADALAAYGSGDVQGAMRAASQSPYLQDLGTGIASENMRAQQAMQRDRQLIDQRERLANEDRMWRSQESQSEREWRAEQARLQREAQAALANQRMAQGSGEPDPYFQALPTANGYVRFNARTGAMEPVTIDGKPVVPGTLDPALQGELAGAKKAGALVGESEAQAQIDLPSATANAAKVSQQIDELLAHPGFSSAVGAKGASQLFGVLPAPLAGTDAAGFNARLEQIKGGAFLDARQMLKGGGAITDFESRKAEAAFTRMSNAVSEEEFRAAAKDYKDAVEAGVQKLRAKAGQGAGASGDFGTPDGWQDVGNGVRVRVKQ